MKNRTRRTNRKRKTQKRIKGAGYYESDPELLFNKLKKFITKHYDDIKGKDDMVQAVKEYKEQMRSIDNKDYLALRNYIFSKKNTGLIMAKIPPEKRPPPLESTPDVVCNYIGEYFFTKKQEEYVDKLTEWLPKSKTIDERWLL